MLVAKLKKKIHTELEHKLYWKKKPKNWVFYFTKFLNLYNLQAYKKIFIFKNLRYLTYFKNHRPFFFKFKAYKARFWYFRREPYYVLGLFLLRVFATGVHNEDLFAKFISKYIKLYHRRKRNFNKFFFFLRKYAAFLKKLKYIKGFKLQLKGRLRGKPRSKQISFQKGRVPLQTKNSYISYALKHIPTTYGIFGLKIWIHQIPKLFKKKKKLILKSRTFLKLVKIKNKKQKYLQTLFPGRYKKLKFFKKTKYKKFSKNRNFNNQNKKFFKTTTKYFKKKPSFNKGFNKKIKK